MNADPIVESLEIVAARMGDVTPVIYERYFSLSPDSAAALAHVDEGVKAKMMNEIYRLLMSADYEAESSYLSWEVDNHQLAYSVEPAMYDGLFQAIFEVMQEGMGNDWNETLEAAWTDRLASLKFEIVSRFAQET